MRFQVFSFDRGSLSGIESIYLPINPFARVGVVSYQNNELGIAVELCRYCVADRFRPGVPRRIFDWPAAPVAHGILQGMVLEIKRVIRIILQQLETADLSLVIVIETYKYV